LFFRVNILRVPLPALTYSSRLDDELYKFGEATEPGRAGAHEDKPGEFSTYFLEGVEP
jgi:hypothetical protein